MQTREELLKALDEKFQAMGQNTDVHLSGLLHADTIKYWDYIQVDALLGLQIQRTSLPDEMVFIMYHQINEIIFKMILWEIDQVAHADSITAEKFTMHLERISRYFDLLSNSFNIMRDGMEVSQYMKFRDTLTPASGFQSAQYRKIEFASTDLLNLIDFRVRKTIDRTTSYDVAYDNLYWQAAGTHPTDGSKSTLLLNFEKRYKKEFLDFMQEYNTINLWARYCSLPEADRNNLDLINAMRHYDHTINVSWVMNHFNAARHYIDSGEGSSEATGGSDWKKYMLPKYQKRIFYPELWTDDELDNWGIDNLEGHKNLTEIPKHEKFKGWQK